MGKECVHACVCVGVGHVVVFADNGHFLIKNWASDSQLVHTVVFL